jgi:hypothetical protein
MTLTATPNPYAPPVSDPAGMTFAPRSDGQVSVDGNALVVAKGATLADCCVKCGRRDDLKSRHAKFNWYPPWVFVFLLCNIIILAIAMQIVRKRGQVMLPICSACDARWKGASQLWGLLLLGTFVLPILFALVFDNAVGLAMGTFSSDWSPPSRSTLWSCDRGRFSRSGLTTRRCGLSVCVPRPWKQT